MLDNYKRRATKVRISNLVGGIRLRPVTGEVLGGSGTVDDSGVHGANVESQPTNTDETSNIESQTPAFAAIESYPSPSLQGATG